MTAAQFRKALERVGATQSGFARLMGVEPRQARRWASGDSTVPRSVEIILTLWVCGKISEHDF